MQKLGESSFTLPGHHGHCYNPIARKKEPARDFSGVFSTQSLGDEKAMNHPESMDNMAIDSDAVAYLVALTIDGKSAGQLSRIQGYLRVELISPYSSSSSNI